MEGIDDEVLERVSRTMLGMYITLTAERDAALARAEAHEDSLTATESRLLDRLARAEAVIEAARECSQEFPPDNGWEILADALRTYDTHKEEK